jgi:diacylglycerol kinase (ATP)
MARATIIHNATAGDGRPTGGELRELVRRQGYAVRYATTDEDVGGVLQDPGDLVVVAGGDGTVGKVATWLLGRAVPLVVLPVGTANNLAESLGLDRPLDDLASGWRRAERRELDVATVWGPWGAAHWVESFGLGLFPFAMPLLSALKKMEGGPRTREAELRHDRRALRALLEVFAPLDLDIRLDDQPLEGSFLMLEIMNAPRLGPRLPLAPDADPCDRRLVAVLVHAEQRDALGRWLESGEAGELDLDRRVVERVELEWQGEPLHIDGDAWAGAPSPLRTVRRADVSAGAPIRVQLEARTVPVLVPARDSSPAEV